MSTSLCSSRDKANAKSVSFPSLFWWNACTFLRIQYVHTIQESTNTCIGNAKSLWHAPPELEPLWTWQRGCGMSQAMILHRTLCPNGVYPSWLYGVMVISATSPLPSSPYSHFGVTAPLTFSITTFTLPQNIGGLWSSFSHTANKAELCSFSV